MKGGKKLHAEGDSHFNSSNLGMFYELQQCFFACFITMALPLT